MKKNSQFTIHDARKGFTLVELLTAVSIFAVIMTISMGSIVGVFDANRKSRSHKTVMSNLNLAIESMSKEMRFGKNYHCGSTGQLSSPQNCPSADVAMTFLNSEGVEVSYRFVSQVLEKKTGSGEYIAVTAPELVIDVGRFYVLGAGTSNVLQPKVMVMIKAHAGSGRNRSDFTLETLVSQRALDI